MRQGTKKVPIDNQAVSKVPIRKRRNEKDQKVKTRILHLEAQLQNKTGEAEFWKGQQASLLHFLQQYGILTPYRHPSPIGTHRQ